MIGIKEGNSFLERLAGRSASGEQKKGKYKKHEELHGKPTVPMVYPRSLTNCLSIKMPCGQVRAFDAGGIRELFFVDSALVIILSMAMSVLGDMENPNSQRGGIPMKLLLLPVKVFGWAVAGMAIGVGWKLGTYLVNAATADENVKGFMRMFECSSGRTEETSEPIWARKFPKFSDG